MSNIKKIGCLVLIFISLFLFLFADYKSSVFGRSYFFSNSINDFEYYVEYNEAKYVVRSAKSVAVISEHNRFLSPHKDNSFFINEIKAISPQDNFLYVLVTDSLNSFRTIVIQSINWEGFINECAIVKGSPNMTWIVLNKSNYLQSKILLNWNYVFWFFLVSLTLLLGLIVKYLLRKSRDKSEKNSSLQRS